MKIIDFLNLDIEKTSDKTANTKAIVLRENNTNRIVFIPKIVDKNDDWTNSVCGCFIAQRKGKNEKWDDIEGIKLSQIKKGEWTKFDITASEIKEAVYYSSELSKLCEKEKDFKKVTDKKILFIDSKIDKDELKDIIKMIEESDNTYQVIIDILSHENNWERIINYICEDSNKEKLIDALKEMSNSKQNELIDKININRFSPEIIYSNLTNGSEQYWQEMFQKNPHILSEIIPSMLHIISSQAFMGTKNINNRGANITDFVYKNGINNMSIIEIKTPLTPLLGEKYRENVYCPSKELVGAITQVKEQKNEFIKNYNSIVLRSQEDGIYLKGFDPKCYLIIGQNNNLNNEQMKSFELFRNELKEIEIITYNEVAEKIKLIYDVLRG